MKIPPRYPKVSRAPLEIAAYLPSGVRSDEFLVRTQPCSTFNSVPNHRLFIVNK